MASVDEIISESKDVREVKRALSVKMVQQGMAPRQIGELLNVSVQYVSKWKLIYQAEGVGGLMLGYQGSHSYLNEDQRQEVIAWVNSHETLSVEELRDYLEITYGVVYQSKQSYYELLEAGGMSYHKSQKANPKRDEEKVQLRREEIKKTGSVLECHLGWRGNRADRG